MGVFSGLKKSSFVCVSVCVHTCVHVCVWKRVCPYFAIKGRDEDIKF